MTEAAAEPYDRIRESWNYKSPYERWKESEGLPTVTGYYVQNLLEVELSPWASRGGSGVYINLEGSDVKDAYLCEIPPGKSLNPLRHIYEDSILICKGRGATTVWLDDRKKQTFEWAERSFFALPPNARYQHHNLSGTEPARLLGVTTARATINLFKSLDFVFNNPYVFSDRFDGESGYFDQKPRPNGRVPWVTNFVADALASNPMPNDVSDSINVVSSQAFTLVNSTIRSHTSSWPVGTYQRAHRHAPDNNIVILRGLGYSLLWPESDNPNYERIDWQPYTLFIPPEQWFHQHFNVGPEPVCFLDIGWMNDKVRINGKPYVSVDLKQGGDTIEFWDEDPKIHEMYEAALAKNGVTCRMGGFHPCCTQK